MPGLLKKSIGFGFCLLYILAMIACTSSPVSRGTGEYFSDSSITARIKTQLATDPVTKAHQINIETYRGSVQLNGFVDTQQSIDRATEIAKGTPGVTEVRNNLAVRGMRTPQ